MSPAPAQASAAGVLRPAPARVMIVDDEAVLAATLQEFLQGEGYDVVVAADAPSALTLAERFDPEIALCDIQLPGSDGLELLDRLLKLRPETLVLMITAYATVESAVAAFRRGAHDYLMKPVIFEDLLAKVGRLSLFRRVLIENQALRRQTHDQADPESLVGRSPLMRQVKSLIRKVGPTRSNVLITGESGTGKELVARALHAQGPEPDSAFLAINSAAIPYNLLENQLFGHVRGAFTGADRDHAGLFVAAGRGTVFLDEIAELSPATQAKLLRTIEMKEVLPLGGTRPVAVAARVVAATNKELTAEVAAGRFRADLYYRLDVVTIHLPPLRDRREDIPELIEVLLARHVRRLRKRVDGVDNATVRGLMAAPWKGNVRELDNALERALILAEGTTLTPDDFPPGLIPTEGAGPAGRVPGEPVDDLRAAVRDYERHHIRRVLESTGDDKREAARRLGLGLSSLYRKLEELGSRSSEAPPPENGREEGDLMRCTRCDRPAVPQAVAITPGGLVVFGWCLACLESAGCEQIEVARPSRGRTTRLSIGPPPPWSLRRFSTGGPAGVRPDPLDERRRLVATVAAGLTLWGLLVMTVELVLWSVSARKPTGPQANGTPALLIGGAVTAAVGVCLWALNSRRFRSLMPPALRVIQGLAFLAALGTLLGGIVYRNPRRSLLVVGVASAALCVSAAARWVEVRRSRSLSP